MEELTPQPTPQPTQPTAAPTKAQFCTSCGSPADSGASFCTNCGANLYISMPAAAQPAQSAVQQSAVEQPVDAQPAVQPVAEPVVQPVMQPAAQPAVQPAAQPAVQPAAQPAAQPAEQPFAPTPQPAQPFGAAPQHPLAGAQVMQNVNFGAPAAQPVKLPGTAALVCGILAIALCFAPPVAIILGIVAIIQAKKINGTGKAKAARICGVIGIVLSVLMFAAGVFAVSAVDDIASSSSSSSSSSISSSSSSSGSVVASSSAEAEVEDLITDRFDDIKYGRASAMGEIAAIADAGFEETLDFSLSECGVTSTEYAEAITEGFDYDIDDIILDERLGTGTVYIDVDCKNILDIMTGFATAVEELDMVGMTETEALKKVGDSLMEVIANTPVEDDFNFAVIDVELVDGEWVIVEDSWEFELDYMFSIA